MAKGATTKDAQLIAACRFAARRDGQGPRMVFDPMLAQ